MTYRPAARIILLDDRDHILLFRVIGTTEVRPFWITPGGGLDADETFEQCAKRELWEETGLLADELGPVVWRRRHVFAFQGTLFDQDERFLVVRCRAFEPSRANFETAEATFMVEHRWWTVHEIAQSDASFAPGRMAELLTALIAGDYPAEPIDSGV